MILNNYNFYFYNVSEKDILLVRNAELSQQLESLKRSSKQDQEELDLELQEKSSRISNLESAIEKKETEVVHLNEQVNMLGQLS